MAAPTSYPLKCRGSLGPELNFEFSATVAHMGFKKSAYAATMGLKPGECAWMDRALNAQEPMSIEQYPLAPKTSFSTTTIRYGHAGTGALVVAPMIGGRDTEISWMKELLVNENAYWLFMVYNDGVGHLVVTSAQSTTP